MQFPACVLSRYNSMAEYQLCKLECFGSIPFGGSTLPEVNPAQSIPAAAGQ
jgi:hypothetical protein